MNIKEFNQIKQVLGKTAPVTAPEKLFERVLSRIETEKSPTSEPYATLFLSMHDGDQPVSDAIISLTDNNGDEVQWNGTRHTTDDGRGVISVPLSLAKTNPRLHVRPNMKHADTAIVKQLTLSSSRRQVEKVGTLTLEMQWITDYTELTDYKKVEKIRRFNVAVAGTGKNINEPVDFVRRHGCFRLKKVLLDGKPPKDLSLPKNISVAGIDKDIESRVEDIDVILDFSNSKLLREMYQSQMSGERKFSILIIPAQHLSGSLDRLERVLHPPKTEENKGD
jgi:hypothetical protein